MFCGMTKVELSLSVVLLATCSQQLIGLRKVTLNIPRRKYVNKNAPKTL